MCCFEVVNNHKISEVMQGLEHWTKKYYWRNDVMEKQKLSDQYNALICTMRHIVVEMGKNRSPFCFENYKGPWHDKIWNHPCGEKNSGMYRQNKNQTSELLNHRVLTWPGQTKFNKVEVNMFCSPQLCLNMGHLCYIIRKTFKISWNDRFTQIIKKQLEQRQKTQNTRLRNSQL